MIAAIIGCLFPALASAENFKSSDFLEWKYASQRSYIDANVGMASLIAGQSNHSQGQCIDNWFFQDADKAIANVRDVMKRFPAYHPRGVILAVIEKQCGKITTK